MLNNLKTNLTVDLSSLSNVIDDLTLEQKEWPGVEAFLTWDQIIAVNNWSVFDNYGQIVDAYLDQCRINDDGSFDTTVYVFTSNPDYQLVTSNGTFDPNVTLDTLLKEDSVLISLESYYKFQYNVEDLLSYEWEGDVFNETGQVITPPIITLSNNMLVWDTVAYGTIRYSINVVAYSHTLNVPPIDGATDNIYATNVLAFQDGEVYSLEIQEPETNDACKDLALNIISSSTPPVTPVPTPDPADTLVPVIFSFFDYCTGEVVAPTYMIIDAGATITDFDTPIMLLPGTHSIKIVADGYISSDEDDLANDEFTITVVPILPTV